jgi:hypothetical protein
MSCLLNCQSFTLVLNALEDRVAIYDRDGTRT